MSRMTATAKPSDVGRHDRAVVGASLACFALLLLLVSQGPEPDHPEWAIVTREFEGTDWPLVTSARYDAVNHFILVDLRPGVSLDTALRLACESVRPRLDAVDATVGFALYEPPDRVVAHREDCADGAWPTPREYAKTANSSTGMPSPGAAAATGGAMQAAFGG